VGLLFPDLAAFTESEEESPLYIDQVIRGAEREAAAAGVAVLIAATRGAGRKLARTVVGQVDGLVVLARSLPVTDIETFSRSVPIVVLADRSNGSRVDYVGAANRDGMRELTAHLLTAHRFTRLAFVGGPARSPDSEERFAGFRIALREAGLPVPGRPAADGGFTEAGGARAMRTLLASGKPPQAVLFGNDEMAVGGLAVLRAAGLRVPSGIAVTGFDDIALSRHVQPSLTTVRQPMHDLGQQAVRVLLARMAKPASRHQSLVLPTQLVVRRSCGCRARPGTATEFRV
jgi:LacI family transcriptional regulator